MTLSKFALLSELEQIEVFYTGVPVGEIRDGEFVIACRQVDTFYVEYKILGGHYIDMRCFKNPDFLQPYLEKMDLSQMLS